MNNDLGNVVSQVANKFSESDGINAKVDGSLQALMGRNMKNTTTGMGSRKERKKRTK